MNDLPNEEKHDENQIDEEPLGVEEPKFTSLVAKRKQRSHATDEQEEYGQEQNNLENDFDELMDCTSD